MSSKKCLDTLFEAVSSWRPPCLSDQGGEVLHIIPSAVSSVEQLESMKAMFICSNKYIDLAEQCIPTTLQQCQDMLREEKAQLMKMRIRQSDIRCQVLQLLEDKRVLTIQLLYYKADLYSQKQQTRKWRQKYESLKRKRAANKSIAVIHRRLTKSCSTENKEDSQRVDQIKKSDMESAAKLSTPKKKVEDSVAAVEIEGPSSIQTRSEMPSAIDENNCILYTMECGKQKNIDETSKEIPLLDISIPSDVKKNKDVPTIQQEVACTSLVNNSDPFHESFDLEQNQRIENIPNENLLSNCMKDGVLLMDTSENFFDIHFVQQNNNMSWEEEHPHDPCNVQKKAEISPKIQQCDSNDLSTFEHERDIATFTDKKNAVNRHHEEQVFTKNLSPKNGINLDLLSSRLDDTGTFPRDGIIITAASSFSKQQDQILEGHEGRLTRSYCSSVDSDITSPPEKDVEEQESLADRSFQDGLHPEERNSFSDPEDYDQIPTQQGNYISSSSEKQETSSINSLTEERCSLKMGIGGKSLTNEPIQGQQCCSNNICPGVQLHDEIPSIWQDPSTTEDANSTNVIKGDLKEELVSSDRASYCIVQTSEELSSIWQDDSILFSAAKSKVSEEVEGQVKGITDEGDAEPHLWVTMSRDRKAKRKFTPDIDTTANRSVSFNIDGCLIDTEKRQEVSGFSDSLTADDLSENLSHSKAYINFGNDDTALELVNVARTPCSLSFSPDPSELECSLHIHAIRKDSLRLSGNELTSAIDNTLDTRSSSLNGSAILETIMLSSSSEMHNDDSFLYESISAHGITSKSMGNSSTLPTEVLKKNIKRGPTNILFSSFQAPKLKSQKSFVTKRRR